MSDWFLVHYDGDFEILRIEPEEGETVDETVERRFRQSGLNRRFDSSVGELFQVEISDSFNLDGKVDFNMFRFDPWGESDE